VHGSTASVKLTALSGSFPQMPHPA